MYHAVHKDISEQHSRGAVADLCMGSFVFNFSVPLFVFLVPGLRLYVALLWHIVSCSTVVKSWQSMESLNIFLGGPSSENHHH
jgi:hypothetical protein